MKNHPFFDEKIISMNVYSFWKKCFDQNEASQYDSNVKRMFYYRILELKNPTKLNQFDLSFNVIAKEYHHYVLRECQEQKQFRKTDNVVHYLILCTACTRTFNNFFIDPVVVMLFFKLLSVSTLHLHKV